MSVQLQLDAFFEPTPLKPEVESVTPLYRNIGEVAKELDIPAHVLRFWETKFTEIQPIKRSNGRRYYRAKDIEIIRKVKTLLYDKKFTIPGAKSALKAKPTEPTAPKKIKAVKSIDGDLRSILKDLDALRTTLRKAVI